MTPQPGQVLGLFQRAGAYLTGHFRLTSGLHSPNYLQSALVLQYPQHAQTLGEALAARISSLTGGKKPDLVISPALGGMIVGHETARALGVRFLFTERDAERKMSLRRGFVLAPGELAVVVEDVITTGGSTREVLDIVRSCGAVPLAAGSIIDRSGGAVDLGIPRVALETLHVTAYDPAACPLCRAGEPVVKPGSRPA
ncbi:MAG TPA: orotate phosphoribosyltransferase [Bryobacteraceae bacterium]|nr:orotate phosphoribosyltransferase [Bryobacteraceae bacterium]